MKIIGQTTDSKLVVDGVFRFYDTVGLPFGVLFGELYSKGIIPSWPTFYADAKKAGWKDKKILREIDDGLRDAGLVELAEVVVERLRGLA